MRTFLRNLYRYCYYRLIIPILREKKEPEFIARGVAVGLFCAFTPVIFQMYIVLFLWFIAKIFKIRFSLPIALALTWVSNGITNLPLFFTYYVLGSIFLHQHIGMSYTDFIAFFDEGIINGVKVLIGELGKPILLGSVIIMMVSSTLGYILTYRFIVRRRERIAFKKAKRELELLDRIHKI